MCFEICQKLSDFLFPKECDDSISNKVFIDNITLGLVYIGAYIVLALIVKPLGAGRVLGNMWLNLCFVKTENWWNAVDFK